jgi:anti-anti-sigma factor
VLTVSPRVVGDVLVLGLSGRVDGSEGSAIQEAVRAALDDGHTNLILDLREIDWMNSLGVGYIVAALVSTRNRDAHLKLLGTAGRVAVVLRKCGLIPHLIEIFENETEAVASFT